MQRSIIASIISVIGIIILLRINYNIAAIYAVAGGKTRAMFFLIEYGFFYKYYVTAFGITAVILSILAVCKQEDKKWVITAVLLSAFVLIATFTKLWKFMVWMHC